MFLYGSDDQQSAWGPDRTKACRFASVLAALNLAMLCGYLNEGASAIGIAKG